MWPWSKVLGDVLSVCIKALLVQGCQVCVKYEDHLAKTLNFFIYCFLSRPSASGLCKIFPHNISKLVRVCIFSLVPMHRTQRLNEMDAQHHKLNWCCQLCAQSPLLSFFRTRTRMKTSIKTVKRSLRTKPKTARKRKKREKRKKRKKGKKRRDMTQALRPHLHLHLPAVMR